MGSSVDFDHYSDISLGLVAIDTSYFATLKGKRAQITLRSLGYSQTPAIYYNSGFTLNKSEISQACPENICTNISYINGTLSFQASFSSFKIGQTQSCSELSGFLCQSDEKCNGNLLNALEINCCSVSCTKTPPKFSDAEKCTNLNDSAKILISKPKSGKEFNIGDQLDVKAKITNDAEDDMEFTVIAYLYDLTDDQSVKDKEKDLSIDKGKSKNIDFSFNITDDLDESHDYVVLIYAEDGICNENYETIKIKKQNDQMAIKNLMINPDSLVCGDITKVSFDLKNIGLDDEDVQLQVKNSELGISQETAEFTVEKDESIKKDLIIHVPEGIKAGSYPIEVKALYNGNKDTSATVTLTVDKCLKQETTLAQVPVSKTVNTPHLSQSVKQKSSIWIMVDILLIVGIFLIIILVILISLLRK
jgi:hypothetical protein